MVKLRLLLIGLLTPLFCGVSFGAGPIPGDLISSYSLDYSACQNLGYSAILGSFYNSNDVNNSNFGCFYVQGPIDAVRGVQGQMYSSAFQGNLNLNFMYGAPLILCGDTSYLSAYLGIQLMLDCNPLQNGNYIDFEFYDFTNLGGGCSSCETDLATCYSSLSTLQGSYNTLSGNYTTCQNSLNSCQNNGANCDTLYGVCVENLSGCVADKDSLQNYNESLSSQLSECLSNSENGTGSSGSGLMLVNNSLFWYYNDSLLSLPITNNLFLPLGYQGVLDSGNVLYISALSGSDPEQYYFSDDDKVSIIDLLSYLFIFILGIGVIFSLIKLFKKLFTH